MLENQIYKDEMLRAGILNYVWLKYSLKTVITKLYLPSVVHIHIAGVQSQ